MNGLVLGIVPARGGSRGVPQKNLKPLAGKPLLAYAAEVAAASGVFDRVVLSTDDEAIAALGRSVGLDVPFMRPPSLAQDDTPMLPVLLHAITSVEQDGFKPDFVILLQPTSPLRLPVHIRQAATLLQDTGCDSVVSVTKLPSHCSPDYVMKIKDGRLSNFLPEGVRVTRRQEARPAYVRDGTVYAFRRDLAMNDHTIYGADCRALIVPPEESLSIDTEEDWMLAERRLTALQSGATAPSPPR
jgi:CMP-N,N'-diacetyllegionaminic acid synthase